MTPASFRAELAAVPPRDRDAWLDRLLGLDELPRDEPELPRGCVPYLPCSVATLMEMVELADVRESDVFVDVGSGLGRPGALVHLLTGAGCIGIEIQPGLVREARRIARRSNLSRSRVIEGDAVALTGRVAIGTVFFLYCPFGGERFERVLRDLEAIARARTIRVCCVDLPVLSCSWLAPVAVPSGELAVYRSVAVRGRAQAP